MHPTATALCACAVALALGAAPVGLDQSGPDDERPPIAYSAATPVDAVAALRQRITRGDFVCPGVERALLAAVLRELEVPTWLCFRVPAFNATAFGLLARGDYPCASLPCGMERSGAPRRGAPFLARPPP
jgi:hypothetical protein